MPIFEFLYLHSSAQSFYLRPTNSQIFVSSEDYSSTACNFHLFRNRTRGPAVQIDISAMFQDRSKKIVLQYMLRALFTLFPPFLVHKYSQLSFGTAISFSFFLPSSTFLFSFSLFFSIFLPLSLSAIYSLFAFLCRATISSFFFPIGS